MGVENVTWLLFWFLYMPFWGVAFVGLWFISGWLLLFLRWASGDAFVVIDAVVPAELFNTTADVDRSASPINGTFGKSSGFNMLCWKEEYILYYISILYNIWHELYVCISSFHTSLVEVYLPNQVCPQLLLISETPLPWLRVSMEPAPIVGYLNLELLRQLELGLMRRHLRHHLCHLTVYYYHDSHVRSFSQALRT